MKKILAFIHDGYADYESAYFTSFITMSKEGEIVTISPNKKSVISKGGLTVKSDLTLGDKIKVDNYDAFILVGGS
ncbi:MAG: DJ-1/PfpI family protein, partial [Bacilli bacterium]|nr:DJ-1/PfpI family protein [Bacilli bacterium]